MGERVLRYLILLNKYAISVSQKPHTRRHLASLHTSVYREQLLLVTNAVGDHCYTVDIWNGYREPETTVTVDV